MMRRWVISAMLSLVFVSSVFSFYKEVLDYNPVGNIDGTIAHREDGIRVTHFLKPAWGKEIVERNLFSPWRGHKPPPPPKPLVQAQPAPIPKPNMVLNGIILDTLGEYAAYLRLNGIETGDLKKGDTAGDIRIIDVSERSVEILWNDEIIKLSLEETKNQ